MKFARIRSLNLLAALVLVHQLGACGCGCADHNAWIQAANWCLGSETEPSHHSHHQDDWEGLAIHDPGHCEGEHLPVEYLRQGSGDPGTAHAAAGVLCSWQMPQVLPIRELVTAVDSTPPRIRRGGSAPLVLRI